MAWNVPEATLQACPSDAQEQIPCTCLRFGTWGFRQGEGHGIELNMLTVGDPG